ncbi:sarcosine oxidase subunit gamma family protein [Dactylosporangium sp. NPDC005572]|uniref:sarcosine oxidase subunit gamma n=1 Tax=Dactylosporangium sp. NPDC005572 TaxID=3156889 RepID=UPI00339E5F56
MADLTALRHAPLAHLAGRMLMGGGPVMEGGRVRLEERPFLAMASIRVDPASEAAGRICAALGAPLPAGCGETAASGPHTALWLGPDEWLVVSETDPDVLTRPLVEALGPDHGAVVDVSANRTVLELSGAAARAVLQKGCPVDLHPRAFGAGRAVATTLARVPLVLWQSGPATYRLLPRSSFADYVARWLLDAMREFRVPPST